MNCIFEKGRQGFGDGSIDWDTNKLKALLVDINDCPPSNAGGWIITTHNNSATATITTSAVHGLTVGDVITIKTVAGTPPTVATSTAYSVGAVVSSGTKRYRAVKGGTSAASAPSYPTNDGDYVVDGTVVWLADGPNTNSILNDGAWDPRGFASGTWPVNTTPTTTTFTLVLPNAPGTYTSGGFLANLSKQFLSEFVPSGGRISTTPTLTSATITNGNASAANTSFPTVTGDPAEAMIIVKAAALTTDADLADTSQRLIAYFDSGPGLPYTPNGGNFDITFPNPIFKL